MKKVVFLAVFLMILTLPVPTWAAEHLTDGQYMIEVTLSGGSGRAQVESPAELKVNHGAVTAIVKWSSPYYEYMLIDGIYYYPIKSEGNSTFEIPVVIDRDMAVKAQTVAMSEPHEIDYTLRFNSAVLKSIPGQGDALPPLRITVGAVLVVLAGAGLVVTLSRRRAKGRITTKGK